MVSPSVVTMENCGMKNSHTQKLQKYVDSVQVKTENDDDPIWAYYSSLEKQGASEAPGVKTEPLWVKSETPEFEETNVTRCENFLTVQDRAVLSHTVGIKNEDHIWESFWDCYNSVPGNEDQNPETDIKQETVTIKQECYAAPNLLLANASQTVPSPAVTPAPKKDNKSIGNLQNETFKLSNPKSVSCVNSVSSYKSPTLRHGIGSGSQVKDTNQQVTRPPDKLQHIVQDSRTPQNISPSNKLSESYLRPAQVHHQPQSFRNGILQQTSKSPQIISVQPAQQILLFTNCFITNTTQEPAHQSAPNFRKPHLMQSSTTNEPHSPSPGHERAGENNVPQQGGVCLERSASQQEQSLLDCFQSCQHCKKAMRSHYVEGSKHKIPRRAKNKVVVRNWKCCQCDVALISSGHLICHLTKKHVISKCVQCDMSFNSKNRLAYHIKCKHAPPASCEVCGKVFRSGYYLRVHQDTHNEELIKHFCELCGKGFRLRSALQMHMYVHTEDRPFKCPDCKAAFKTAFHLARHRITHTDLWPFSCHVCQNKFRTKANLISHLKTHDKDPLKEKGKRKRETGTRKTKKIQLSESEEEEEEEEEEWEEQQESEEQESEEQEESDENCEEEDADRKKDK